jgi:hypothetical protein
LRQLNRGCANVAAEKDMQTNAAHNILCVDDVLIKKLG